MRNQVEPLKLVERPTPVAAGDGVGYLLCVHDFSLEHLGLTAEIDEFFVAPSRRGNGLGGKLLPAAESDRPFAIESASRRAAE